MKMYMFLQTVYKATIIHFHHLLRRAV